MGGGSWSSSTFKNYSIGAVIKRIGNKFDKSRIAGLVDKILN